MLTDQVTHTATTLYPSSGASPTQLGGGSDETLSDNPIQGPATLYGDDPGDGGPSVGDDELVAVPDQRQVVAQTAAQFSYADFHVRSVHM